MLVQLLLAFIPNMGHVTDTKHTYIRKIQFDVKIMKEKEAEKLSKKCTKIRDALIDEKLKDEKDIRKRIRKEMSKKEIEELAVQFLLKEAVGYLIEEHKIEEEQKADESTEMMFA